MGGRGSRQRAQGEQLLVALRSRSGVDRSSGRQRHHLRLDPVICRFCGGKCGVPGRCQHGGLGVRGLQGHRGHVRSLCRPCSRTGGCQKRRQNHAASEKVASNRQAPRAWGRGRHGARWSFSSLVCSARGPLAFWTCVYLYECIQPTEPRATRCVSAPTRYSRISLTGRPRVGPPHAAVGASPPRTERLFGSLRLGRCGHGLLVRVRVRVRASVSVSVRARVRVSGEGKGWGEWRG